MKSPPRLQDRRTPRWLFEFLDDRFGPFELDAFADPRNALCERYFTQQDDGTKQPWARRTFANPPFAIVGQTIMHAVQQGFERNVMSVVLGPTGCSQRWFQEFAIRGTVFVPDRRISYDMPDGTPTDPSKSDAPGADRDTMVYVFGGDYWNQEWRRGVFRVLKLELPR